MWRQQARKSSVFELLATREGERERPRILMDFTLSNASKCASIEIPSEMTYALPFAAYRRAIAVIVRRARARALGALLRVNIFTAERRLLRLATLNAILSARTELIVSRRELRIQFAYVCYSESYSAMFK